MGGADVAHGRLLGHAEQPHQLEGVDALERLVEDSVLAQAVQGQALGECCAQGGTVDVDWFAYEGRDAER
ncbi:hypothetical protein SAZ11_50415 [Streptomyces sp. FXJ1.4098]|nr:hypothetical protein [Streptomyces sp. FXJ1.4098]